MLRFSHLAPLSVWSVSLVLLLLSLAPSTTCFPGGHLWPRATQSTSKLPVPISFAPAQNWEGIDGSWNTFVLRIGTPIQTVRVMISTASQQIWTIDPRGCPDDTSTNTTCAEARGMTYNYQKSSSWKKIGLYDLWIESNLGLSGNAEYGYETAGLGYPGEGGPTLDGQTVGVLATDAFYFGHFGIAPKPTNFTNFTTQSPSFMTSLKDQGNIPSVSWGYTAGAPYRFAKVLGSLTLGGYDSSKFVENAISFPFAPDNERDILVSINSIKSTMNGASSTTTLLTNQIYSYIDSTIAEIWLPVEACVLFERTFGITYDDTSELYLVSEAQHNALLVSNPNITLNISPYTEPNGPSVDITLPYAAFDQTAKPPYQGINASSRYFPLRRATNDSAYTLGRTFLQEAYLTVDWERNNFSVAQCSWVSNAKSSIIPISAVTAANSSSSSGSNGSSDNGGSGHMSSLGVGAIAGIAVGAVAILFFSTLIVILYLRNKRRAERRRVNAEKLPPKIGDSITTTRDDDDVGNTGTNVLPKAELDASEPPLAGAMGEYYKPDGTLLARGLPVHESDSKERAAVYEMEGDTPRVQEADGHGLSEKQAMRVREERVHGTDPGVSPVTPNGSDRSPTSTLATSTFTGSTPSSVRPSRPIVRPGDEVVEFNPADNRTMLVSPLDGSNGINTMMMPGMSPLSPVDGNTGSDPGGSRKRFSYEDP